MPEPSMTPREPDATLSLSAELMDGMWTIYAIDGEKRTTLGAGSLGSGIMFPVRLLDRLTSEPS